MQSKSILSSSKKSSSSKKAPKRKVVKWRRSRHTCPVCKGSGLLPKEHVEYLNQVLQWAKQGRLQEVRDAAYAQLEFAEEMGLDEHVIVKLSNGRIEEARINRVIRHSNGTKPQVDFGHDETPLVELWQVLEDS
jgi:hypothetical protein